MKVEQIKTYSKEILDELVGIRRHLHKHPELSFQEYKTSFFIKSKLNEWGISFQDNWVNTGIVADLTGELTSNKNLALRADIDALPIQEVSGRIYGSENPNIMHACGHDVHTTCLLGSIKILKEFKHLWGGKVLFIFQPGEEKLPGGASLMIKEGLLEYMNANVIIGQHVHPPLEVGKVGFHSGRYMASADELYVTITGKGGHAALPDDVRDPIAAGAELILTLKKLATELDNEINPIVLSIGKFWSEGGATNIVPERVFMEGTFRAMDEKKRLDLHRKMEEIADQIGNEREVKVDLEIRHGYPSLFNDPSLTSDMKTWAVELLGRENVVELPKRMTSEDFAFYSQAMPGCFFRLGVSNRLKGISAPVHSSNFDVDESCLSLGAAFMAYSAMKYLNK